MISTTVFFLPFIRVLKSFSVTDARVCHDIGSRVCRWLCSASCFVHSTRRLTDWLMLETGAAERGRGLGSVTGNKSSAGGWGQNSDLLCYPTPLLNSPLFFFFVLSSLFLSPSSTAADRKLGVLWLDHSPSQHLSFNQVVSPSSYVFYFRRLILQHVTITLLSLRRCWSWDEKRKKKVKMSFEVEQRWTLLIPGREMIHHNTKWQKWFWLFIYLFFIFVLHQTLCFGNLCVLREARFPFFVILFE